MSRLVYCSRLIIDQRHTGPCHWTVNILAAISVAVCYGATATMLSRIQVVAACGIDGSQDVNFSGPAYGVDISGWSLVMVGIGLLVQSLISIWIFIIAFSLKQGIIRSWSGDAVVNTIFLTALVPLRRSSHNFQVEPGERRRTAHEQIPRARRLVRIAWATFALLIAAIIVTVVLSSRQNSCTKAGMEETSHDRWQFFGFYCTPFGIGSNITNWAGALCQSGMQGLLAASMHCADVVIGLLNDEDSWQDAYSRYAESAKAFVPRRYQVRWRTILLFAAKSGLQWAFASAVSVDALFSISLIPLMVVTSIVLLVAVMLEAMTR